MYILKNAFGIFWLWELGFRLTRLGSQEISHRFWGNPSPILGNASPILGNASPILGMRHRFWGNPSPILRKSITDFGEIRYQFWGNASPILGKACAFFGKNRLRFWDKQVRFGEKLVRVGGNGLGFWIGLGQSSSLTALNAKHVWVWIFEVL